MHILLDRVHHHVSRVSLHWPSSLTFFPLDYPYLVYYCFWTSVLGGQKFNLKAFNLTFNIYAPSHKRYNCYHATKGWFIWMFVYHNDVPSKKEQLHVAKYQMAYPYTNLWRKPNKLQLIQGNINWSTGYLLLVAYLSQPVEDNWSTRFGLSFCFHLGMWYGDEIKTKDFSLLLFPT